MRGKWEKEGNNWQKNDFIFEIEIFYNLSTILYSKLIYNYKWVITSWADSIKKIGQYFLYIQ